MSFRAKIFKHPAFFHQILLCLVIFVIFGQTLNDPYTYFDDTFLIRDQSTFLTSPNAFLDAFRHDVFWGYFAQPIYYRPLLTHTFILDALIGHLSLVQFHLTNILLQCLTASLLYFLLVRFKLSRFSSLLLSILFAVHPALAHTTAWIPGRNDQLLAVFLLAAVISFLNWRQTHRNLYRLAHWSFFALAMFTKESAVFIPVIIIVYLFEFHREHWVGQAKKLLPGWAIAFFAWYLLRAQAFAGFATTPLADRLRLLPQNLPSLFMYSSKLVAPVHLSMTPLVEGFPAWLYIVGISFFVTLGFFAYRQDKRWLIFGGVWYLLFLLPGLIPGDLSQPAHAALEHRAYVPTLGLIILLGILLFKSKPAKPIATVAVLLATIIFGLVTFKRLLFYDNPVSFWQSAIKTSPQATLAYTNLGTVYFERQEFSLAKEAYEKALQISATTPNAWGNLGMLYIQLEDYPAAKDVLEHQLALQTYPKVLFNYGIAVNELGDANTAEQAWLEAVNQQPDHIPSLRALTQLYYYNDLLNQAKIYFDRAHALGETFDPEIESTLQ